MNWALADTTGDGATEAACRPIVLPFHRIFQNKWPEEYPSELPLDRRSLPSANSTGTGCPFVKQLGKPAQWLWTVPNKMVTWRYNLGKILSIIDFKML